MVAMRGTLRRFAFAGNRAVIIDDFDGRIERVAWRSFGAVVTLTP